MSQTISVTRSWLKTKSVTVPEDWLEACVEWINEENQSSNLTQQQTIQLVYEQWLLADLHELGTRCLPDNLADSTKYQLSGSYALQIDSMVDVSQSYYSQLQKIQGTANANVQVSAESSDQKPWEPKPTRMLMMKLTDGTTNVQGMEYKTINCLNTNLSPGTKIVVYGSVLCRRGVLMLTGNNVKLLGGEVDTLMETSPQDKVLRQMLDNNMTNTGNTHKQVFNGTAAKSSKQKPQNSRQVNNQPQAGQQSGQGYTRQQQSPAPLKHGVKEEMDWEDELALADFTDDFDDFDTMGDNSAQVGNNAHRNMTIKTEVCSQSAANHNQNSNSTSRSNQNPSYSLSANHQIQSDSARNMRGNRSIDNNYKPHQLTVTDSNRKNQMVSVSNRNERGKDTNVKKIKLEPQHSQHANSVRPNSANVKSDIIDDDDFVFDDDAFEAELQMELDRVTDMKPSSSLSSVNNSSLNDNREKVGTTDQDKVKSKQSSLSLKPKKASHSSYVQKEPMTVESKSFNAKTSNKIQNYFKPGESCPPEKSSPVVGVGRNSKGTDEGARVLRRSPRKSPQKRPYPERGQRRLTDFTNIQSSPDPVKIGGEDRTDAEPFTYLCIINKQLPAKELMTFKVKVTVPYFSITRKGMWWQSGLKHHAEVRSVSHLCGQEFESCVEKVACPFTQAYISTLVGRLESVGGMEWKLACKINDGTASMEVDLSNGVLTELIGFSAPDSVEMKKRSKHDRNVREIMIEGIQQCQQKLIELLSIMEIQTSPRHSKPVVTTLRQTTSRDLQQLHNRVMSKHVGFLLL